MANKKNYISMSHITHEKLIEEYPDVVYILDLSSIGIPDQEDSEDKDVELRMQIDDSLDDNTVIVNYNGQKHEMTLDIYKSFLRKDIREKEYHVFGGCDIVMISDDKIISEVLSVKYDDKKKEVEVIFPNDELNCNLLKGKNLTISYVMAEPNATNSYIKTRTSRTISGLEFSHEKGCLSIDTLGTQIYVYKYEELSERKIIRGKNKKMNNTVAEYCPHCEGEAELEPKFIPQKCDICGHDLLPCAQCHQLHTPLGCSNCFFDLDPDTYYITMPNDIYKELASTYSIGRGYVYINLNLIDKHLHNHIEKFKLIIDSSKDAKYIVINTPDITTCYKELDVLKNLIKKTQYEE